MKILSNLPNIFNFMNPKSLLLFSIVSFYSILFWGCGGENGEEKSELNNYHEKKINSNKSTIKIDTFLLRKIEIDDCNCRLSKDSVEFCQERYIYFNNCGERARMKINDSLVYFQEKEFEEFSEKLVIINLKSEKYKTKIYLKKARKTDKITTVVFGTITISYRSDSIQQKFYGKCGY